VISPSCFSLGGRRGVQYQYSGDKENIPQHHHQDEDDEDGPILYRDDDEMEDEGEEEMKNIWRRSCISFNSNPTTESLSSVFEVFFIARYCTFTSAPCPPALCLVLLIFFIYI
jgi:hypothetical protein